jgi:hypothetical protein
MAGREKQGTNAVSAGNARGALFILHGDIDTIRPLERVALERLGLFD